MSHVSIIIRTKNKADSIEVVLQMVFAQTFKDFEVIVVDSGSTDETLEIVRKFPVQIIEIPAYKFTYGYAMNVGCSVARGELFVALSAHSIPKRSTWLSTLISPFQDPMMAGVSSDGIHGEMKYTLQSFVQDLRGGLGNNNSAYRMDLWREKPFDEKLLSCEDKEWGLFFLRRGYEIMNVIGGEVFGAVPATYENLWRTNYNYNHAFAQFLERDVLNRILCQRLKATLFGLSRWELIRLIASFKGQWDGSWSRIPQKKSANSVTTSLRTSNKI